MDGPAVNVVIMRWRGLRLSTIGGSQWCLVALSVSLLVSVSCRTNPYDASQFRFLSGPIRLAEQKKLPFDRSWESPELDWSRYDCVEILPVRLQHLDHSEEEESAPRVMANREEAVAALAVYAEEKFKSAFEEDEKIGWEVADAAESDAGLANETVVLEIALTEFAPAKPLVNVVATGVGLLAPFSRRWRSMRAALWSSRVHEE